jgi:trehalose 6-phosphate synthase
VADGLLVCSNRGPFTYEGPADAPTPKRGGGGLIGAVAPVMHGSGGTWLAAPLSDTDRELARSSSAIEQDGFGLRFIDVPPQLHHLHYDVMSNEVLWFLFHYLFDVPHSPTFDGVFPQAWDGYREVNELFAKAVCDTPSSAVLVQDYHFMLVGSAVRRQSRARRPLVYFHHTPWCEPDYFGLLPSAVGAEIIEAMLAYDVVGFHARRWADAFVRCCERYVRGAVVTPEGVTWKRRTTKVVVAPVPVDAPRLRAEADDPDVRSWVASHDDLRQGRKLLVRVDRIDLSKNPLRGFLAFELLLERRPELVNQVLFLALLYPSRLSVERYQTYFSECLGVVRRINERFDPKVRSDIGPIHLLFEDDFHRSLGALRLYDVLLVNPVFDGLNLVCKEGAVVNERSGPVILSRNAGAYEELAEAVVGLQPFDVPGTADAIEKALDMPDAERQKRAKKLVRLVTRTTPQQWLEAQLNAAG